MDVPCKHVSPKAAMATMCVPLTAQGETMGLLALENMAGEAAADASLAIYIELMSETLGLALANLNLREALHAKALTDPLTGLRNRHELDGTLRRMAADASAKGNSLGVLMIDIDRFKKLNDAHGHDAGDLVIRAVADAVAGAAGREGAAFRYGGEEFLLLLPDRDEAGALDVAEGIERSLEDLHLNHGGSAIGPVTVSMGLALYPQHGQPQSLVATADAALYRAKEQGRNRVVVAASRKLRSVETG